MGLGLWGILIWVGLTGLCWWGSHDHPNLFINGTQTFTLKDGCTSDPTVQSIWMGANTLVTYLHSPHLASILFATSDSKPAFCSRISQENEIYHTMVTKPFSISPTDSLLTSALNLNSKYSNYDMLLFSPLFLNNFLQSSASSYILPFIWLNSTTSTFNVIHDGTLSWISVLMLSTIKAKSEHLLQSNSIYEHHTMGVPRHPIKLASSRLQFLSFDANNSVFVTFNFQQTLSSKHLNNALMFITFFFFLM